LFLHVVEAGQTAALISSVRYQRYWRICGRKQGKI